MEQTQNFIFSKDFSAIFSACPKEMLYKGSQAYGAVEFAGSSFKWFVNGVFLSAIMVCPQTMLTSNREEGNFL